MQTKVVNIRGGNVEHDVYIGRQRRGSKLFDWGNPFVIGRDGDRQEVLTRYEAWLKTQMKTGAISLEQVASLHGKTLGCWCKPEPCHGDILARAAKWAFNYLLKRDVETAEAKFEQQQREENAAEDALNEYQASQQTRLQERLHASPPAEHPVEEQDRLERQYEQPVAKSGAEWKKGQRLMAAKTAAEKAADLERIRARLRNRTKPAQPARIAKTVEKAGAELLKNARVSPPTYAGVGSRSTPRNVRRDMAKIARQLASMGWHLHTGGAEGADAAFADAVKPEKRTIFLPWPKFGGHSGPDTRMISRNLVSTAMQQAEQHHPAWNRCSQGAKKLHARNVAIMKGQALDRPVKAVVCWTPNSAITGGTDLALRIAEREGIPVFNLATMKPAEVIAALKTLRTTPQPVSSQPAAEPPPATRAPVEATDDQAERERQELEAFEALVGGAGLVSHADEEYPPVEDVAAAVAADESRIYQAA